MEVTCVQTVEMDTPAAGNADFAVIQTHLVINWSHKARAWLEHSQAGKDWSLSGRHDGYVSRFGMEHRRTVSARADGVEFLDCLLPCNDRIPAEVVFQFAPDLDIEGEGFTRAIKGGNEVLALISFDAPGEIELHRGDPDESLGWVSARFGEKEPAPRLVWRGRIPRQGLRTALTWSL
jgi:Heparinase II/III-like protein